MNLLQFLFLLYTAKTVFVDENPHLQTDEDDYDEEYEYDECEGPRPDLNGPTGARS